MWTLPEFSTRVKTALETQVSKEWDKLIEECAYHIVASGDMKGAKSYEECSRLMYSTYPCIACEMPPELWTFFKRRLSQKLRNIRWSQKKRSETFAMKEGSESDADRSLTMKVILIQTNQESQGNCL